MDEDPAAGSASEKPTGAPEDDSRHAQLLVSIGKIVNRAEKLAEVRPARSRSKAWHAPIEPPSEQLKEVMMLSKQRRGASPEMRPQQRSECFHSSLDVIHHVIDGDGTLPLEEEAGGSPMEEDGWGKDQSEEISAGGHHGEVSSQRGSQAAGSHGSDLHSSGGSQSGTPEPDEELRDPQLECKGSARLQQRVRQLGRVLHGARTLVEGFSSSPTAKERQQQQQQQQQQSPSKYYTAQTRLLRAMLSNLAVQKRDGKAREASLVLARGALEEKFYQYRGLVGHYRQLERSGRLVDVEKIKAENRFLRRERLVLYRRIYGHLGVVRLPPVKPLYSDTEDDVIELMEQCQAEHEALKQQLEKDKEQLRVSTQRTQEVMKKAMVSLKRLRLHNKQKEHRLQGLECRIMEEHDEMLADLPAVSIGGNTPASPATPFVGTPGANVRQNAPAQGASMAGLRAMLEEEKKEHGETRYEMHILRSDFNELQSSTDQDRKEWNKTREWLEACVQRHQETIAGLSREKQAMARKLYARPPQTKLLERTGERYNDSGASWMASQASSAAEIKTRKTRLAEGISDLAEAACQGACDIVRATMESTSKLCFYLKDDAQAHVDAVARAAEKAGGDFPKVLAKGITAILDGEADLLAAEAKKVAKLQDELKKAAEAQEKQHEELLSLRQRVEQKDKDVRTPSARRKSIGGDLHRRSTQRGGRLRNPSSRRGSRLAFGHDSDDSDGSPSPHSFSKGRRPSVSPDRRRPSALDQQAIEKASRAAAAPSPPKESPKSEQPSQPSPPSRSPHPVGIPVLNTSEFLSQGQHLNLQVFREDSPRATSPALPRDLKSAGDRLRAAATPPTPGCKTDSAGRPETAHVELTMTSAERAALREALRSRRQRLASPSSSTRGPEQPDFTELIQELELCLQSAETDAEKLTFTLREREALLAVVEQHRAQNPKRQRAVHHVGCQVEDLVVRSLVMQTFGSTAAGCESPRASRGDLQVQPLEGADPSGSSVLQFQTATSSPPSRAAVAATASALAAVTAVAASSSSASADHRRFSAPCVHLRAEDSASPLARRASAPLRGAARKSPSSRRATPRDSAKPEPSPQGYDPSPRSRQKLQNIYHLAHRDMVGLETRNAVARLLADAIAAASRAAAPVPQPPELGPPQLQPADLPAELPPELEVSLVCSSLHSPAPVPVRHRTFRRLQPFLRRMEISLMEAEDQRAWIAEAIRRRRRVVQVKPPPLLRPSVHETDRRDSRPDVPQPAMEVSPYRRHGGNDVSPPPPQHSTAELPAPLLRLLEETQDGERRGRIAELLRDAELQMDARWDAAVQRWVQGGGDPEDVLSHAELQRELSSTAMLVAPSQQPSSPPPLLREPDFDARVGPEEADEWVRQLIHIDDVEEMRKQLEATVADLSRQCDEGKDEIERLEKRRVLAVERAEVLETRMDRAQDELCAMSERVEELNEMTNELRQANEKVRGDLEDSRRKARECQADSKKKDAELSSMRMSFADLTDKMEKQQQELDAVLAETATRVRALHRHIQQQESEKQAVVSKAEQQVSAAQRLAKKQVEDEIHRTQKLEDRLVKLKKTKEEAITSVKQEMQRQVEQQNREGDRERRRALQEAKLEREKDKKEHAKDIAHLNAQLRESNATLLDISERLEAKCKALDALKAQRHRELQIFDARINVYEAREGQIAEEWRQREQAAKLEAEKHRVEALQLKDKLNDASKHTEEARAHARAAVAEAASKHEKAADMQSQMVRLRAAHQEELVKVRGEVRQGNVQQRVLASLHRKEAMEKSEQMQQEVRRLQKENDTLLRAKVELEGKEGARRAEQDFWRRDTQTAARVLAVHRPLFQLLEALKEHIHLPVLIDEPPEAAWAERFFGLTGDSPRSENRTPRRSTKFEFGTSDETQLSRALVAANDCAASDEKAVRQALAAVDVQRKQQSRRTRLLDRRVSAFENRAAEQAGRWEALRQGLLNARANKFASTSRLSTRAVTNDKLGGLAAVVTSPAAPEPDTSPGAELERMLPSTVSLVLKGNVKGLRPGPQMDAVSSVSGRSSPRPRSDIPTPRSRRCPPPRTAAPETDLHWTETGEPPPRLMPTTWHYSADRTARNVARPPSAAPPAGPSKWPQDWHSDGHSAASRQADAAEQASPSDPPRLLPPAMQGPRRPGSAPPPRGAPAVPPLLAPIGRSAPRTPVSSQGGGTPRSLHVYSREGSPLVSCQASPRSTEAPPAQPPALPQPEPSRPPHAQPPRPMPPSPEAGQPKAKRRGDGNRGWVPGVRQVQPAPSIVQDALRIGGAPRRDMQPAPQQRRGKRHGRM
eukprot:TRINITY_DN7551_c0_g1_i1.p1 TRINITY_DN7551_c0_g1~~TRINITY_DN7551_c0_g1_i1.p1  ORF type:complete len:2311 (+),score=683.94 TRINITY_DN7551_c0_g1_i1:51-6983(+)